MSGISLGSKHLASVSDGDDCEFIVRIGNEILCLSDQGVKDLAAGLVEHLGVAIHTPPQEPRPIIKRQFSAIIEEARATHAARGEVYQDGFIRHAEILDILFPNGLSFSNPETAAKYVLFEFILGKVVRYAVALDGGKGKGHRDSTHDVGVYAFLLEQLHENGE